AALGAEVQVICVNHRNRAGVDVTWRRLAGTRTQEEWDGRVRVTRVGRRGTVARFDFCLGLPRILARLRLDPPDIVHLHVPNPTMLLGLALFRPEAPLAVTYHSDIIRQRKLARLLRPLEHFIFRKAARILSTSDAYPDGSELLQGY